MATFAHTWAELQEMVRALPVAARVWILVGTALFGMAIVVMAPVEVQPESYHAFAPSGVFGIKHFGIVASNLAFLIVGLWGLWFITRGGPAQTLFTNPGERWPYVAFFVGTTLVAFGSGYYHTDPTTPTLLWDRLAMTVIFMSALAVFITDRIHVGVGVAVMLPALLCLGALSMAYWHVTEDLRLYRLVQVFPFVLTLVMCLLFRGRLTKFKYVVWMGLWFGLATAFEQLDKEIYALIRVSGHTIKHPAAAVACAIIIAMLRDAAARKD